MCYILLCHATEHVCAEKRAKENKKKRGERERVKGMSRLNEGNLLLLSVICQSEIASTSQLHNIQII